MRKTNYFLCSLFFLLAINGTSQNRTDFFKTYTPPQSTMPEWAQMMYAEDPCVFEVDFLYQEYFENNSFIKNTEVRNYLHWRRIVGKYLNEEGYIRMPSQVDEQNYFRQLKQKRGTQFSSHRTTANWTCMGPFETYANGTNTPRSIQANIYAFDQSASNPMILIAGTEGGGVYRSTDKGVSWNLVSAQEEFVKGIGAVKIHPTNPDHIFVGGNRRIYESNDGGQTWVQSHFIDASANEIRFDPSQPNIVYCTASNGLYKTIDGGDNWSQIFSQPCYDIDFHPTNNAVIYLLKENTTLARQELFRSDDGGTNWVLKDNGWYLPANPANASVSGGKIGVTAASPEMVYVGLIGQEKSGDNGWIGVYRSLNRGESWVNPVGQNGSPYQSANTMPWNIAAYSSGYHQGFYNFDLEVSDIDPAKLWVGTVRLSESADSAKSWIGIGGANSQRTNLLHADIQDLEVNGNEIWVASDGGLNFSTDELQTEVSKKNGITAADFWGFGSGWNEDLLVGGKYHNGNSAYYQTYGAGNFMHLNGVEESTGYVNPLHPRTAYFGYSDYTDVVSIPDQLGGTFSYLGALALRPNEAYTTSYSSLLYFDPRYADHVYLGKGGTIFKSTNGGYSFDALYEFGVDDRVLEFESARSNTDVWYSVVQPGGSYWTHCVIYKSVDAGTTWTQLPNIPSNRFRLELTINPEDENDIWVSSRDGANGQKVFQSTDGGTTWEVRNSSILDGEKPKDILFQGGTDDLVYLATDNGIFYWDGVTSAWLDFSAGLPLIANPLEMRPFYRDGKLRIATYGRGIYETNMAADFRPIAQPITDTDVRRCSRDTVQFDCYSMLRHNNATWAWTFSPAPSYVSSLTDRNPKVVFGGNGKYTVSLTVTDGNSVSSTQTITDMVEVISECEIDKDAIKSLKAEVSGDYAQSPDFNKTVNQMTIAAWVKPDGIQPDYAGIVINDGVTAGFNFKNGDNSLAYHWPGGQWWWNSGLIVPENEWSYVAMVMTPTSMTLYVNGESATHDINLDPVLLTTMKIGSYKAWNSRNFKGEIEEVAFWDRALSMEEIRMNRHLTKVNNADPSLFAYYQFNETTGQVLDKIGNQHLRLNGAARRVTSSCPVGDGDASKLSITAAGEYVFPGTGLTMEFPVGGIFPEGEVYVSRIETLPYEKPNDNDNLGCYWVINNYGTNTVFSVIDQIKFQPFAGTPTQEVVNNPSSISLHKRTDNADANNWVSLCTAQSVTAGTNGEFIFDNSCGLNSFSQFFINATVAPLPVELLDFRVTKVSDQKVQLNWNTASEDQLSHFELEHAVDGRTFSIFDQVKSQQVEGEITTTYQATHTEVQRGGNYYRLKMVDHNGEFSYSAIRMVEVNASDDFVIGPNPVKANGPLYLENRTGEKAKFLLYDETGKLIKNVVIDSQERVAVFMDLPAGVYFYGLESRYHLSQGKVMVVD